MRAARVRPIWLLASATAFFSCADLRPVLVAESNDLSCEPKSLWPKHWECQGATLPASWGASQGAPRPTRLCTTKLGPRSSARVVAVDCSKECVEAAIEAAISDRERNKSSEAIVFSLSGDCGAVVLSERHHDVTIQSQDPEKPATICSAQARSGCEECRDSEASEVVAIHVSNVADVGLLGLKVAGLSATRAGHDAIGVHVEGSQRIAIVGNTVENVGVAWKQATGTAKEFNARGIWVRGTSSRPSKEIVIAHNRVMKMVLGYSEAVAASGEVVHFAVIGNTVQDVDNIGIDVEGDCDGVAREGLVCGNDVGSLKPGNQAYWKCNERPATVELGEPTCRVDSNGRPNAAGIYVDGGRAVDIAFNRVQGFDYGVQVSTEKQVPPPTGIRIRSNTLADHVHSNIHLGFRAGGGIGDCGTLILANDFGAVREPTKCDREDRPSVLQRPMEICAPPAELYRQIEGVSCAPVLRLGP